MNVFRELWTREGLSEDVRTTYGYVLELHSRLEYTFKAAHEELLKAEIRQKSYCDTRSPVHHVAVGARALILLPKTHKKLLLQLKASFRVVEKRNKVDYVIDLGNRTSLFTSTC